ncbi:MAG: hypothetical protein H7Y42_10460 [Chitinophagaceae bacterium]|nr:hypothetical protein [Chitinophagaceae bacterium]
MMRKFPFLTVCFLFLAIHSYAQFAKGTRMVGASVASMFFNSGTSDQTVTSIGSTTATVRGFGVSITPSIGWFISGNTAVGASLNLNPSGETISFEERGSTFQRDKFNNFNIGFGGFVRNYFKSGGSVLPFGQIGLNAGISNLKKSGFFYGGVDPNDYKETYEGNSSGGFLTEASFLLGVTKMMGDQTGLDLYIGYNFSYNKNTMKTTRLRDDQIDGVIDQTATNETTSKYTNHRFLIGVGFQIFLRKK